MMGFVRFCSVETVSGGVKLGWENRLSGRRSMAVLAVFDKGSFDKSFYVHFRL